MDLHAPQTLAITVDVATSLSPVLNAKSARLDRAKMTQHRTTSLAPTDPNNVTLINAAMVHARIRRWMPLQLLVHQTRLLLEMMA